MTQGTIPPTPDQLLAGNARSFKFKAYGDTAEGIILSQETKQATDPATGEKQFYRRSGDPVWQILYTMQTNLHEDQDDDGRRTLYAKGGMFGAIRQAREKIGAERIEDGGYLKVIYTGDGEAERGLNPPKLYVAEYRRPTDQVLDSAVNNVQQGLGGQPQPTPQQGYQPQAGPNYGQPVQDPYQKQNYAPQQGYLQGAATPNYTPQQQPPAPQVQPAQPVQQGPTPQQIAALQSAGIDVASVYPGYQG